MGFFWAVFGAVLSVVLTLLVDRWRRGELGIRGELAGKWLETVSPGRHKDYERFDLVEVRHRRGGRRFTVTVKRQQPPREANRRWKGLGYVSGNDLAILCFPTTSDDESSFGTVFLHRCRCTDGSVTWEGYYARPATDEGRVPTEVNRELTPVRWERYK